MSDSDERAFDGLPEGEAVASEGSGARYGVEEKRRVDPEGRRESDKERQWLWKLLLTAVGICTICTVVSLAVSFSTLHNRKDIAHNQDVTARIQVVALQAAQVATQLADVVGQIQDERARATRDSCQDTNDRHNDAIKRLNGLIEKLPPEQRVGAEKGKMNTITILDAIVPYQDCAALVRKRVKAG